MRKHEFLNYAHTHYKPPYYIKEQFDSDINKIVVLKKLFRRYTTSGSINERLVLNNIIIILNVFGIQAANTILFYKVEGEHHTILKTFLVFLNSFWDGDDVCGIQLDKNIITILRGVVSK